MEVPVKTLALPLVPAMLLGLMAQPAVSADSEYRIAVVDPNRVVEQSPQYEAARDALQREIEERERNLREQQEQIAALQRQLERDGLFDEREVNCSGSRMIFAVARARSNMREMNFKMILRLRQNELRTKLSRQVQEVVVELAKEQTDRPDSQRGFSLCAIPALIFPSKLLSGLNGNLRRDTAGRAPDATSSR
jgi:outer membrane protein